ncbi:uncharacterized protein LOC124542177 [Vanessa cardui]|uniref:uncharacterized protein LOC124542177 n=1 Tax=Vanessa cardui TaxID=171605 RepID=UPI001F1452E0|nr:uncharacterized protein LOC124542177 [Vanessa cardui]
MGSRSDVYVISLDAVDVNLLPTSYKYGQGKVVPIWTKSNLDLRNNDYYEFEIRSNENIQSDKKNTAIEYMTCHICDLDVPRVYLNEHKESFIHKFNTKIADVALKRLQLYMTSNDDTTSEIDGNPSTYYCRECSMIVNLTDEISHKKSRPHKNSVVFERFLKDFLHLYTNDENVNNERNFKTENQIDNEFKIIDKKDLAHNKEIARKTTDTIVDKPRMNVKDYLTVLNSKYETETMFLKANCGDIEIEAMDGSIVRVCEESFHAFRKIGQKFIQCMLCKDIFDLASYNDHIMSDRHMKMVSLPLKDKHCVRQISESRRHCVVCNTIIDGTDIHTLCDTDHSDNLKNLLISDKINEIHNISDTNSESRVNDTVTPKLLYNDVLKSIPSNNSNANNVISNIEVNNTQSSSNEDTNRKRFCDACNVSISVKKIKKHESTMKHVLNTMSDNHYLLKIVDVNILRCKVCDVDVKNHYDDIDNHFSNADHVNRYDSLLNLNSIKRIDEMRFYCANCDVTILFKNEYLHVDSKEHKIKSQIEVKSVITENRKVGQIDEEIVPATVRVIVVPNVDRVEEATNFSKIVDSVENGKPVTNVNYTVEQKSVGNIIDRVANLSKALEPAANVSKIIKPDINAKKAVDIIKPVINDNKTVEPLPSSIDKVKEVETVVKPDANINKTVIKCNADDPNYYFCVICQVKVPNNYHNIKIHNEGRPHKKILDKLLGNIVKKPELNVANEDLKPVHYLLSATETAGVLHCVICKSDLTNSEGNIKNHLQDASHMTKYTTYLKENSLVIVDGDVYCAVCVVKLGKRCEISHCTGKKHISNMNA